MAEKDAHRSVVESRGRDTAHVDTMARCLVCLPRNNRSSSVGRRAVTRMELNEREEVGKESAKAFTLKKTTFHSIGMEGSIS